MFEMSRMSNRAPSHGTATLSAALAFVACRPDISTPINKADDAESVNFRARGVTALAAGCQADPPPDCKPIRSGASADDLVVSDCRIVSPGTFTFGNVNVVKGGTLFFVDAPGATNLYARSIIVQRGGSVRAGAWCQPFGSKGGKLTIGLWGGPPDQNTAAPGCKDAAGKDADCYPRGRVGKVCTGTDLTDPCQGQNPSAAGNSAMFEGYDQTSDGHSLKLHGDGEFSRKVFAVSYGGSVELFGKKGVADASRTDPSGPGLHPRTCAVPAPDQQFDHAVWAQNTGSSWARLNADAKRGAKSLTLDRSVDWVAGDKIVLSTTDWHPSHSELLTLAGASDKVLALAGSGTTAAHEGDLYTVDTSKLSHDPGHKNTTVDVRAAAGLLTRSITIRSMGATLKPDGKPMDFPASEDCGIGADGNLPAEDCYYGGHVVVRQGFGKFQVQGVEFYQLGQGGRMGHYPVHFHLAKDTSYTNAFVTDSSMWESNTRFVTIHGTHGVNVARNVGFLSVGHAFYLEDGSEIGNSFCYNLGVSARAPFREYFRAQDRTSPTYRAIPPILSSVGMEPKQVGIDASTPAMFWIMNADNDFTGNKAAGVHGVGACYWPLNSSLSGPSRYLSWTDGYAKWNGSNQVAPLRRFRGNSCSTSAYGFMTERGSGFPDLSALQNSGLTAVASPHIHADDLPMVAGNFPATKRAKSGVQGNCVPGTIGAAPANDAGSCAVTILDHFTTSFNWAEVNVGSVWLRAFHYVFSNSAVTDQLYGGIGFVSGGSPEQALTGQLAIAMNSLFVGSTRDANPAASSLGPDISGATNAGSYRTLLKDGVPYYTGGFQPKRLITIYDGPFYADGNVFIADKNEGNPPSSSVYLRTNQPLSDGKMRVVDAGIGWKQPNAFYYPPIFGFRNSGFGGASTRHNVVDQYVLYTYGTGSSNPLPAGSRILGDVNFTPIDTMTILNDLDGTLNGVKPKAGPPRSSGLSSNYFYDAPFTAPECSSFGTSTMPYEFTSTFIARLNDQMTGTDNSWMGGKPAVAIYRQYRLPDGADGTESCTRADKICSGRGRASKQACRRGTFFMGASIGQGMGLTVRDGVFFVDTASESQNGDCLGANNVGYQLAQFEKNKSYSIYNLFANSGTRVTYQIYVGKSFDWKNSGFRWLRVLPRATGNNSYATMKADPKLPALTTQPGGPVWFEQTTGVLTVTIDQRWIAGSYKLNNDHGLACQPTDLCKLDSSTSTCIPARSVPPGYEGLEDEVKSICRDWVTPVYAQVASGRDKGLYLGDCPAGGCLGFAFTLPGDFQPKAYKDVGQTLSTCYPKDETWNRPMVTSDAQSCPVPQGRFCTN